MSLAEGGLASFLTKEPLWQVIKHEISLKRARVPTKMMTTGEPSGSCLAEWASMP